MTRRPLESYPAAVLARWIAARQISYFDEELEAIEEQIRREELVWRFNHLTHEEIATAMEQLPTDALEWGVRFEAAKRPAERLEAQEGQEKAKEAAS